MTADRQEKDVAATVEKSEETSHETGVIPFIRIIILPDTNIAFHITRPSTGGVARSRSYLGRGRPRCTMSDPSNVDIGDWFLCVWKRPQYTVYIAEAFDHSISVRNPIASLSAWKTLGEGHAQLAFPAVEMDISPEPGTIQPKGLLNGYSNRWANADAKSI